MSKIDTTSWLTRAEAAQLLGVAEKTIDRMAERKQVQKAMRKRPGLPPVAVFHPGDLERIKGEQEKEHEPFIMPERKKDTSDTVLPALSKNTPNAALMDLLNAMVERLTAAPALPAPPTGELKPPFFLTTDEAIETAGLPHSTLVQLRKDGKVNAIKTGRGWRWSRADLERLALGH